MIKNIIITRRQERQWKVKLVQMELYPLQQLITTRKEEAVDLVNKCQVYLNRNKRITYSSNKLNISIILK